jgi:hypothetical protein
MFGILNTYKLDKAEELFTILGDYRDSKEYLKRLKKRKFHTKLRTIDVIN